jgi:hypothetical protein
LNRIERKNLDTGFTTILEYSYNQAGAANHTFVDFLTEIKEFGMKDQIQDIYYRYDSRGNWIRKYWKAEDNYVLEARRKIKYR